MNATQALARQRITLETVIRRILSVFDAATASDIEAGAQWYGSAIGDILTAMALASGHSVERCAAVIAHLSPRTPWGRNTAGAWLTITGEDARSIGCIGANVDRAEAAMVADVPLATVNGPKTSRFARNLLGDRDAVTVDVWAARVALGASDDVEAVLRRAGVYEALETAYQLAAARRGVDPATMQATTWVVARNGRAL